MSTGSLLKNYMSYWLGSGFILLLGVISTPYITRIVGPVDYGKLSLFTIWSNIAMVFLVCGLDQSYGRFFYEIKEECRPHLLLDCVKVTLLFSVAGGVVVYFCSENICRLLFGEFNTYLVFLLLCNIIILPLNRFSFLLVRMKQKGWQYSLLGITQKLSYLLFFTAFLFVAEADYKILILSVTLSTILATLHAIIMEKNDWLFWRRNTIQHGKEYKEIIVYGAPFIFTFLITWLLQSSGSIAILTWKDMGELGVYSAAFSIIGLLNLLQTTFSTFWVPVAYEYYENHPDRHELFIKMNHIISFSMLLCGAVLILSKDIIVLILGEKFAMANQIMPFLIFVPIMYTISETTVQGINFMKKTQYHFVIAVICCLLNVLLNYLLVPVWGGKGAAIATGFSYIAFYFARTYISERLLKVGYEQKKFWIAVMLIVIYAYYATFFVTDSVFWWLGLTVIVAICMMYRDILVYMIQQIKPRLRQICRCAN